MPLIYTTSENIKRRLRGRLGIQAAPYGAPVPGVGTQEVDPELLEQVGSQTEARVNGILGQIYEMPLPLPQPMVTSLVEKFIIAELMGVHFQGSQIPELGSDLGHGSVVLRQAREELQTLVAGHNIYIPGIPVTVAIPGANTPQPVVLPGAILLRSRRDTITESRTQVLRRIPSDVGDLDFGAGGQGRHERALGADHPWQ